MTTGEHQTGGLVGSTSMSGRECAEALPKLKGGLRAFYRTLELTRSRPLARPSRAFCFAKFLSPFPKRLKCPGANPLKDAHAALDTAVLTAYGFNAKKDLLAQLLALNQEVAAKIEKGDPVTAPGMPKNYPDAKKLVTEDCIRPVRLAADGRSAG